MIKVGLSVLCLLFSVNAIAEELAIEYKSFYSHVRKINDEQMDKLQFAFGLRHIDENRMCTIRSAHISTDKKQIPIEVNDEFRFTVPLERALKMADAEVILDLQDQANKCDMSVQLQTLPEVLKSSYTKDELSTIYDQYSVFFEDMGGFLSFMMPSVSGLVVHFDEDIHYRKIRGGHEIRNGRLELSEKEIKDMVRIDFPFKPKRITALTQSS